MVMSYEQWLIILGTIDQKANLSKDNIIEKIKKELKRPKIIEAPEISRMLEEVSHELSNISEVQETQEPLRILLLPINLKMEKKLLFY